MGSKSVSLLADPTLDRAISYTSEQRNTLLADCRIEWPATASREETKEYWNTPLTTATRIMGKDSAALADYKADLEKRRTQAARKTQKKNVLPKLIVRSNMKKVDNAVSTPAGVCLNIREFSNLNNPIAIPPSAQPLVTPPAQQSVAISTEEEQQQQQHLASGKSNQLVSVSSVIQL